jgi:hypothetical protein
MRSSKLLQVIFDCNSRIALEGQEKMIHNNEQWDSIVFQKIKKTSFESLTK